MPNLRVTRLIAFLSLLVPAVTAAAKPMPAGTAAEPVQVPSETPPPLDSPTTLLLRFAAYSGATEAGASFPNDLLPLQTEIEATLADWDLRQDLAELQDLFKLAELHELARWSSTVPTPLGQVTTSVSARSRLELASRLIDAKTVEVSIKLFDNGELVSAPRMISELGERMVMSTSDAERGVFFLLFLEVNASDD
ncbi:MAG: hypothetical protein K8J08_15855 [Thermoanaerobaculia bacterium]|nr:hypothetical protein [Thermoanaerobaculia bacterium]